MTATLEVKWEAKTSGTTGTGVGQWVVDNGTSYVPATTSNIASYPLVRGIITGAVVNGVALIQSAGDVPASVHGLIYSAATPYVVLNKTTGFAQLAATLASTDVELGYLDASGSLRLVQDASQGGADPLLIVTDPIYGADPSGVADSTAAFVKVIAAKEAIGCARIYVPAGVYKITAAIDVGLKPFTMFGDGWNLTNNFVDVFGSSAWNTASNFHGSIIRQETAGADLFVMSTASANGMEWRDLMMIGPGSGTCYGIRATGIPGWTRARWTNVMIGNFSTGLHSGPSQNCTSFHLEVIGCTRGIVLDDEVDPTVGGPIDNRFYDTHVQGCTTGIYIANSYANWFDGGLVQTNGTGIRLAGIANTGGESNGPRAPWEWHIRGMYFENNTTAGIHLDGSVYQFGRGTLRDIRSGDTGANAIKIQTNYPSWGISNVTFDGVIAKGANVTLAAGCNGWTIRRNCEFLTFNNGSSMTNWIEYPYADAAPVAGTWGLGDKIYRATPLSGGIEGYICTAAGTPGTWKTFGTIS